RVPSDEDEKPRKDFCLRVSYDEKTVRVGEGMGEREAEYIASMVLARIRPRSWWGEAAGVEHTVGSADADDAPNEVARQQWISMAARQIVLPLVIVGALTFVFLPRDGHSQPAHRKTSD